MKRYLLVLLIVIGGYSLYSQMIPDGVIHAFEKGNAKELSPYFHNTIELNILGETQAASKNQAIRILQDFFTKHPPKSFKVTYEGNQRDTKYGMGTYTTKKDTFKINLHFMDGKKERIIYYLSIEKA